MNGSGIHPSWEAAYFTAHGVCVCDPCSGQSCRICDGTAADEREERQARRTRTATPSRKAEAA